MHRDDAFREIADAAPVMIWISDRGKGCVWFNRPWLDFTGRALAQHVGDGWTEAVHPDDLDRCLRVYGDAFDRRERYHNDYRLRRADGEWRHVEDTGGPRFSDAGEFLGYVGSCVDVTDQRAAAQALRHKEEQLRLATDAAEVGFWDVDVVGDTLFWPPRVKAMFGISADVPVSMADFYAGLHPEDRDATVRAFSAALDPATRALYDVEYRTVGKEDGRTRWVAAKGRGIFDANGTCVRIIGTAIDITPRKRAEEALRESDRQKDEFIATLSHELRNPLAPLCNGLRVLRMAGAGDAESEPIHAMMERQVNHLVRLVDDLLEMSRINHGALELRREHVELATVVRNAVETSQPVVDEAGHALDVALPARTVWLEGDPVRLAQILANLLNNAARYMPSGGQIVLQAQVAAGMVAVSVRDQGSGFAADRASHLFEMFGRGERSSGLGIGLALARRLAEMHGGTIDASSEGPGKGAEFTLRLAQAADPVGPPVQHAHAAGPMQGRRILVVDDNGDAADSMRMLLELLGADVRVARNGRDAVDTFGEYVPEVVLLDIGMPEMDGYEVARTIRERYPADPALIVAVTGWGQERDRELGREAGFDHHLVKPADFDVLQQLLGALPQRQQRRDVDSRSSVHLHDGADSHRGVDMTRDPQSA